MGCSQADNRTKREIKARVFDIIQIGTQVDIPSRVFDYFIVCMILVSICMTFLRTFDSLEAYEPLMNAVERFTIVVFIIEYLLRLWTCELLYPGERGLRAAGRFMRSFYGVVDLLTIISYFGPLYSNGIVALRMIRVIRIMRLFRVNQSFDAFSIVGEVIAEKRKQLLSSICMIAMIMLAASLCMYGFEHDVQPQVFENAFSGIWWAMSTVLTVGYGDIYPITVGGKLVAIIIALLGVCVVAIPTGVISAGFVEYYARLRDEGQRSFRKDTITMLEEQAKKKKMSANEYLLYLMLKDTGREERGVGSGGQSRAKRHSGRKK